MKGEKMTVKTFCEKRKVVIAEDETDLLENLVEFFESLDFEVVGARTGDEAWEQVRAGRPHVVVSDLLLPGCSGFDLLEKIKADAALADIPVIVLSARVDSDSVARARRLGAAEYITKPFRLAELWDAVERAIPN